MLRIARTQTSTFLSADRQDEKPFNQYQRLVTLVRKHLSPVTASVFAQPILQDDRDYVEWYSDLQGQPEPLLSLPENQQLKAKELLTNRLDSVSKLAEQLPQLEPGSTDSQTILQKAVQYPGDKAVYVINGQPVIIFWGVVDPANTAVHPSTANRVDSEALSTPVTKKTPRSFLRTGLLLLSIALLAGLFWFWFSKQSLNWNDYSPFMDEYQLLLDEVNAAENNCPALENIYTNNPLINKEEEKFTLVKKQVETILDNCAAYDQLKKEIDSAQDDCHKLTDILTNNNYLQNSQEPFIELKNQLENSVQRCVEFQKLKSAIDSAKDNCSALSKIQQEDPRVQKPEGLFNSLQQQLDRYIADCAAYETLASTINQARLNCRKLKQLAAENPLLKNPTGKFIALKQQLDTDLKNCKQEQLKLLPKFLEAKFVPGFATFTPESKQSALEEIKRIGKYLAEHKNTAVLITLHTPVSGPEHIEPIARSGFRTTKEVLDARFKNVTDGLLQVPGVSRNQIKKGAYQFNKPSRIVKFKMISRSPE